CVAADMELCERNPEAARGLSCRRRTLYHGDPGREDCLSVPGLTADSVVLVTGASGFIGRHCCNRLAAEPGRHHAVSRRGIGPASGTIRGPAAARLAPGAARRLVAEPRPTHLLHAAWVATPGVFWHGPENLDWLAAGLELVRAFGEAGGRA